MEKLNHNFILSNDDLCEIKLFELNHNTYAINSVIHLNSPNINPNLFQEIATYIINLNNNNIKYIFFDSIIIKYKIIRFNLFGQCRAPFKNKLKEHVLLDNIKINKYNFKWISDQFLPKINPNTEKIIDHNSKKPHNFIKVFKKGNFNNISYSIDNYSVDYSYFYDIHPTDLIPVFSIFVKISSLSYITNNIQKDQLSSLHKHLIDKFEKFNITLSFS